MSNSRRKISKGLIYLPIYLVVLIGAVWFLYDSLNFSSGPIESPPAAVVEEKVEAKPSQTMATCLEGAKSKLGGSLKLFPEAALNEALISSRTECEEKLCKSLTSVVDGTLSASDFYLKAKTEDICSLKLLKAASKYHQDQLKSRPVHGIFYQLGHNELSSKQLKEIESFLSRNANANEDGLLIIGRAGSVGSKPADRSIARSRAEHLIEKIKIKFSKTISTTYVYFGEEHTPLTFELADALGIPPNSFRSISIGSQKDPDFSIRLSQSLLLVPYSVSEDPYGIGS